MDARWQITLLGGLRAQSGARVVSRFYTQKMGALLAYLAYSAHRAHPRDALIDLLWPEADPRAGRNSLSVALSSLRHQLEPPGVPAGTVIVADRASVQRPLHRWWRAGRRRQACDWAGHSGASGRCAVT